MTGLAWALGLLALVIVFIIFVFIGATVIILGRKDVG